MATPPMRPAAMAPAPAYPVGMAPLGELVAEATTDEALEAAFPDPEADIDIDMEDDREVAELTTEETALEAEETELETAAEAEERDPVLLLKLLSAIPSGKLCQSGLTYPETEAVLVVVTAPVGIPEVALEFKHESELPAWMTVGNEYWGLP